jgi:hypothetical protein
VAARGARGQTLSVVWRAGAIIDRGRMLGRPKVENSRCSPQLDSAMRAPSEAHRTGARAWWRSIPIGSVAIRLLSFFFDRGDRIWPAPAKPERTKNLPAIERARCAMMGRPSWLSGRDTRWAREHSRLGVAGSLHSRRPQRPGARDDQICSREPP